MVRKRIMLLYEYQENWIGGTYYILNIIKALNLLKDEEKPQLTILHGHNSSVQEIQKIGYPLIDFVSINFNLSFIKRLLNRVFSLLRWNSRFTVPLPVNNVDNFYPFSEIIDRRNIKYPFAWIPDFQEYHLPQYFSKREIMSRRLYHKRIINLQLPIVFSSEASLNDFNVFYPKTGNRKFVVPFSSLIDDKYSALDINQLKKKFNISHHFFIVTNQLWKHKNHLSVIKAFEIVIQKYPDVQLICTGKEHDYRNPDYPVEIKKYIIDHQLAGRVIFLGFIDRNEQMKLMKESLAIIQPSLFEGWSTVVEDAKVIGQFILLSDIPVHREQININCRFFEPLDFISLSGLMEDILVKKPDLVPFDYENSVKNFAEKFISIF